MKTYPIKILRSGKYLFKGHEARAKYRQKGTVIADCDGETALWLVCSGYGSLWQNDLPSNPQRVEYLDSRLERKRRNKLSQARQNFIIQAVLDQEQSNPTTEG